MTKKQNDYVKICPMCGSTKIKGIQIFKTGFVRYYCSICLYGYKETGLIPEVLESEIDAFRKELKSKSKVK